MAKYTKLFAALRRGGTYFFTLVTYRRAPILTTPLGRSILRGVILECRCAWPFEIVAMVLMPEHLHAVWSLPDGDADYSKRWGWLKKEFTKRWLAEGGAEQTLSEFVLFQNAPRNAQRPSPCV